MRGVYDVEAVAPAHCRGQLDFAVFRQVFGDECKIFGRGETIKL